MDGLNIILLLPVFFGFIAGLFHGLIKELASMAAVILGVIGAKIFASSFAGKLHELFDFSITITRPVAYIVLFIAIVLSLLLVARMFEKISSALALGGLNKLLGGIFGALKIAVIISVFLNVFEVLDNRFSFIEKETKINSTVYTTLIKLGPVLWDEVFISEHKDIKP